MASARKQRPVSASKSKQSTTKKKRAQSARRPVLSGKNPSLQAVSFNHPRIDSKDKLNPKHSARTFIITSPTKPANDLKKQVHHIKVINDSIEERKEQKGQINGNIVVLKKYIRVSANSAHQLKWNNGKQVNRINVEIEKNHRLAPLLSQTLENKDTVLKEIPVLEQSCKMLAKKKQEIQERIQYEKKLKDHLKELIQKLNKDLKHNQQSIIAQRQDLNATMKTKKKTQLELINVRKDSSHFYHSANGDMGFKKKKK